MTSYMTFFAFIVSGKTLYCCVLIKNTIAEYMTQGLDDPAAVFLFMLDQFFYHIDALLENNYLRMENYV